jgi:hypothetical protein
MLGLCPGALYANPQKASFREANFSGIDIAVKLSNRKTEQEFHDPVGGALDFHKSISI